MKVNFETKKYFRNKKDWGFLLIPTIGIGYNDKFLCFSLYILTWEFSVDFDWDK